MKIVAIMAAIAFSSAAIAQMPPPNDSTTTSGAMAPEATPPSADQTDPQTNPGSPSTVPAGSHTMKHHSTKKHSKMMSHPSTNGSDNMSTSNTSSPH